MRDRELLALEAFEALVCDQFCIRNVDKFEVGTGNVCQFLDCFVIDGLLAITRLNSHDYFTAGIEEFAESICLNERAVANVENTQLSQRLEENTEAFVCDFQSPKRQHLQIRRHATNLVEEAILEPVVMLQI